MAFNIRNIFSYTQEKFDYFWLGSVMYLSTNIKIMMKQTKDTLLSSFQLKTI